MNLAVSDAYSENLCRKVEWVSSQTTKERLTLFNQFGTPAIIHENNYNAHEGGTFTFDVFKERSGATLELVELLRRAGGMVTVRADQSSPAVRSNPEPRHA